MFAQQQQAAQPDLQGFTKTPQQQDCSPVSEFLLGICPFQFSSFALVLTELHFINCKQLLSDRDLKKKKTDHVPLNCCSPLLFAIISAFYKHNHYSINLLAK